MISFISQQDIAKEERKAAAGLSLLFSVLLMANITTSVFTLGVLVGELACSLVFSAICVYEFYFYDFFSSKKRPNWIIPFLPSLSIALLKLTIFLICSPVAFSLVISILVDLSVIPAAVETVLFSGAILGAIVGGILLLGAISLLEIRGIYDIPDMTLNDLHAKIKGLKAELKAAQADICQNPSYQRQMQCKEIIHDNPLIISVLEEKNALKA